MNAADGAWQLRRLADAGQACSGYLVEHDGLRMLVDVGYAVVPRLLERVTAGQVDTVLISHGHPDHCADLNPLLRARVFRDDPPPPLPVYALPGALDAVLALDRPGMLASGYVLHEFTAGGSLDIGPLQVQTRLLPHWLPNAGIRLTVGGRVLAYTGDTDPSDDVAGLARGADLLLAEASCVNQVPGDSRRYLSSARQQGRQAAEAGARHLVLTHLMPGTDPAAARAAARHGYDGEVSVATGGPGSQHRLTRPRENPHCATLALGRIPSRPPLAVNLSGARIQHAQNTRHDRRRRSSGAGLASTGSACAPGRQPAIPARRISR